MARKRTPFAPTAGMRIIILHGREHFLMREWSRQVAEVLEEAHGQIEQFVFDGAETDLATVLDELRSYGLMQQHKLVVLDAADAFLSGQETHRQGLERYAAAPVDHATLLLRAETWRPGRLDKAVAKVGLVHKVEPVGAADAIRWCVGRCKKRYETTIEPEAAETLVALIGPELDRLDTELSKLASFAGSQRPITRADVHQLVGLSREQQAWAIQSAIASGDAGRAVATLRELVTVSRQPDQVIIWAVTDLLRKVHAAARLAAQGLPPGAIAGEIKLWGDAREPVLRLARSGDPEVFAQLLRAAVEADAQLKRGFGEPARSLEALVVLVTDRLHGALTAPARV